MKRMDRWDWLGLALLLGLAAALRLVNVAVSPGWFSDEGTHLAIARQLQAGRWQYLAVTESVLLFARLPLFEWLLAGAVRLFGLSMGTLRGVTAVLGIGAVGLLYGMARQLSGDRWLALAAAGVLAIMPPAVLYSRFGFSYNLLAPLLLAALWGLAHAANDGSARTGRARALALACLAVGLGTISDLLALSWLPALLLVLLARRSGRQLVWGMALALLPWGVYTAVSLLARADAFWFDWQFTFARVQQPLPAQLRQLGLNGATLLQDGWLALGFVGLWLVRPLPLRRLALLFWLLPLLVIGRTAALYSLSAYYLIPFLPLAALGLGALLRYGAPWGVRQLLGAWYRPWQTAVFAGGVALLLGVVAGQVWAQGRDGWETAVDPFLLNGADVRAAAAFVNEAVTPEDVVIASPGVAWLLDGKTADFQMAVAAAGAAAPHMPADLPARRWAFDPDYRQARMVVIDNLWHNWAVFNVPGVAEMVAEVETWPQRYQTGAITVYERPEAIKSDPE